MAELLRMPEVAAGATEAVLAQWLVEEGAEVAPGDSLAVIETDKAQVEIEAEVGGVVIRRLVPESREVEVGSPIALLGSEVERGSDPDQLLRSLGIDRQTSVPADLPERRDVPDAAPDPSVQVDHLADYSQTRQFISPIARRLLREAGVDAAGIDGTGPGGRVTRRDVEGHIAALAGTPRTDGPAEQEPAAALVPTRAKAVEHTRIRRVVARRLTESKQSIPHFYLRRTVRFDRIVELRAELNARTGRKISLNDFVLRGVATALEMVPAANVVWSEDAMLQYDTADIAVAVASDRGLVTPVLRSVETMSLGAISNEVRWLAERANSGTLSQEELEGGTITVSNLGMFGVDEFSAIINPPHSAILAVGAATAQPVVVDGVVEVGTVASLVLSVDHRAIDGALAAQWMNALVEVLENPYRLLV